MNSALEYYNPHSTQSKLEWQGLKSARFGRTKEFLTKKDVIKTGFDFPNQTPVTGKKSLSQNNSKEKEFRSIVKCYSKLDHWEPRVSRKKTYDMSFTEAFPRRERSHHLPEFNNPERPAGIRTFYNGRVREESRREYSLEDRLQRKSRVDQYEMRKTFFLKQ